MTTRIWAAAALLNGGWASCVDIGIDADGTIDSVAPGCDYSGGERAELLIPAIPNVHSHAHQRAMAGLGERAGDSADSFWTWRKVMYHYLERIEPEHLQHIAAQLYLEMLKAGYGCVGEFQYLHHGVDGSAYDNRAEMSLQCLQAARSVGIDIVESLKSATAGDPNSAVGIAPHSLRAIDRELLAEVIASLDDLAAIHLHIAEQTREVDDCLAWSGKRPVEWLYDNFDVDRQWCLIHATHMTADETAMMARSGCVAGLCPTTEANLGDGFFNAVDYLSANGSWAIGSDSHISIDPVEELRWLEYGARLQTRRRNVLVSPTVVNTGRNLLDGALAGGERACGRRIGRIESGYRADLVALDVDHPRLYGRSGDELLDSWIFSGNDNLVRDVYIGGRKLIDNGHHADEDEITRNYRATLDRLAQ